MITLPSEECGGDKRVPLSAIAVMCGSPCSSELRLGGTVPSLRADANDNLNETFTCIDLNRVHLGEGNAGPPRHVQGQPTNIRLATFAK
jgi:hypothetical protein